MREFFVWGCGIAPFSIVHQQARLKKRNNCEKITKPTPTPTINTNTPTPTTTTTTTLVLVLLILASRDL